MKITTEQIEALKDENGDLTTEQARLLTGEHRDNLDARDFAYLLSESAKGGVEVTHYLGASRVRWTCRYTNDQKTAYHCNGREIKKGESPSGYWGAWFAHKEGFVSLKEAIERCKR